MASENSQESKNFKQILHTLNTNLKSLESAYNYDIKKIKKTSHKRTKVINAGITKDELLPDNLAEFLKLEKGTLLPRSKVTSLVYKKLQELGLYSKTNGKILRTNNEVTKLFGVPTSVNNSNDANDKNGFNFYNLNKYIKNAYPLQNE